MDMNRKLALVEQNIKSIATHDDEDAALRHSALDRIDAMVKAEREAIDARVQARITETMGEKIAG